MGSRQTSTFFSLLACMCTYYQYNQLTLTENKKKALFYIITACWSKSWTIGHRVVHTQCLNFFYICLYIFIMYVVLCVYVVWYVFYSITLHYYSFFSPHTFQIPANQNSYFCPIYITFSSIVTNNTSQHAQKMILWHCIYRILAHYLRPMRMITYTQFNKRATAIKFVYILFIPRI